MVNPSFLIVSGPSLWDIHFVFDRTTERPLTFVLPDSVVVKLTVTSIRFEPTSISTYHFEGSAVEGSDAHLGSKVRVCFDTTSRKGKLEILAQAVSNPPEREVCAVPGSNLVLVKEWGTIASLAIRGQREVRVGDQVFATNHPSQIQSGTLGIVVKIKEPYTNGLTTDVVEVWFVGKKNPTACKLRDVKH